MKNLLIFTSIFFLALKAQSQNVGIGTVTPATILDVVSTTQGVLIPRVTTTEMNAIANPGSTPGLLVTNTDSLYRIFIYTGTANGWKGLSFTDQNVDTALLVHKANDETIDGTKTFLKDIVIKTNPVTAGLNIGMGNNTRNVILGVQALKSNTSAANDNIGIGTSSLFSLTTGSSNIGIGTSALFNINGSRNNGVGRDAISNLTSGSFNNVLGDLAGVWIADGVTSNTVSNRSIYIGSRTKSFADNQTNQIVIGDSAIGNGSNTITFGNDAVIKTVLKGQVGINNPAPDASAQMDVSSTTKGFLPPRMTTAQRTGITLPAEGLCVYDLTLHKLFVYDGTVWQAAW